MRVALYARVSTRDKGQDVENQLSQLRQYSVAMGWDIVSEFVDHETGSKSDRQQLQAMFVTASQRKFDVLLFWSLDRLSREGVLPTLQYLQRLTGYGIGWRSFSEQYLDSTGMFRDAVISILAVIAKQERNRISERTKAGLERARRQGKVLGRPRNNVGVSQIRELLASGKTRQEISEGFGISLPTISRMLKTA